MARGKQISFPPLQTHKKNFEYAMILISILCIVIVVRHRQGDGLGHHHSSLVGASSETAIAVSDRVRIPNVASRVRWVDSAVVDA